MTWAAASETRILSSSKSADLRPEAHYLPFFRGLAALRREALSEAAG